jgi:excisionase family DNA binding protein
VLSVHIMSAHLSPAQAAKAAGVSRWTVVRAINSQALQARRDNRNQWRIEPEDLEAWRSAHPAHSAHIEHEQEPAPAAPPDDDLRIEAAGLRVEVRLLREERDGLLKLLALAMSAQPAPEKPVEAPAGAPVIMESSKASGLLGRLLWALRGS